MADLRWNKSEQGCVWLFLLCSGVIEPRGSHIEGKYSTTEPLSQCQDSEFLTISENDWIAAYVFNYGK